MKTRILTGFLLAAVVLLLPFFLGKGKTGETTELQPPVLASTGNGTVSVLHQGEVLKLDWKDYLWGVVAAEMPASFHPEALKAQAVAARTYARSKIGTAQNHPEAALCSDPSCCQAWLSREAAEKNWGSRAEENAAKITAAIEATANEVILYNGDLIDAVFHSSSGAATQDAVEVWGSSVPYLQSVSSPEGEEVPAYHSEVTLTAAEFKKRFLTVHPEAVLEGEPSDWFGTPESAQSGSVRSIAIGGVFLSGTEVRELFSLRSACFTVETAPEKVTFHVTGYGHGVGMSQYGANAMAKGGADYRSILAHYYTGVTVEAKTTF